MIWSVLCEQFASRDKLGPIRVDFNKSNKNSNSVENIPFETNANLPMPESKQSVETNVTPTIRIDELKLDFGDAFSAAVSLLKETLKPKRQSKKDDKAPKEFLASKASLQKRKNEKSPSRKSIDVEIPSV